MLNDVLLIVIAIICLVVVWRSLKSGRLEFLHPLIEYFSWDVSRRELPFFYWLGLVIWFLAGTACIGMLLFF